MEEGNLWLEIRETMRLLDLALKEAKERGERMVLTEAAYYTQKANTTFELYEQGYPATLVQQAVKGSPEVAAKMSAYHAAQVEYENAREARNVYKKRLDTLREQYAREWGEVGRSDV